MNRNEPINQSTLIENNNGIQTINIEERYNTYDKINLKYFAITIIIIFLSMINLSFYLIANFSINEDHYNISTNNNEDSLIQRIISEESSYLFEYFKPNKEIKESDFSEINKNLENNSDSLRFMEIENFFEPSKNKQKSYFLNENEKTIVDFFLGFNNTYEGEWSSNIKPNKFEDSNGDIRFNIRLIFPNAVQETMLIPSIVFYDGKYIENLYILKLQNYIFRNTTSNFFYLDMNKNYMNVSFTSLIVYRSLYDKTENQSNENVNYKNIGCKIDMNINWIKENKGIITDINGNLFVEKNCTLDINIKFNLKIATEKKSQYLYYSFFSTITSILGIFSTIWLSMKTTSSVQNSKAISLITLGQNIIWDAYGCITNFFIMAGDDTYFLYFAIPSFLYFILFSVFELRLLYYIWRNKNAEDLENNHRIRRKLLKFYLIFYISMFLGLFFVTKFYFVKSYLYFSLAITWLPQIIYNFLEKNFASIPMINVLIMSFNKLAFPIYIRSVDNNVFRVKPDKDFCQIAIAIVFFESIFGPRFFFPLKSNSDAHKYYYKKEEILQINKDYEFAECLICLNNLFPNDFEVKDNKNKEVLLHLNLGKENLFKRIMKRLRNIFFEFHNFRFCSDKKYIITPCSHVYHSECLEAWLLYKNECPTDRAPLSDVQFYTY